MVARKTLSVVAASAVLGIAAGAWASQTGTTIGLNFGCVVGGGGPSGGSSDIPAGGMAGAPGVVQGNWVDLFPGQGTDATGSSSGGPVQMRLDRNGVAENISTTVAWMNSGASDPGGNDKFSTAGPPELQHFELYQGYLDTDDNTTTRVNIQNLPAEFAAGYDVYVYFLGSVSARGGTYGISPLYGAPAGDQSIPPTTLVPTKQFNNQTGSWIEPTLFAPSGPEANGAYSVNGSNMIEDPGASFDDIGNYGVFRGLTALEFTLYATTLGDKTFGFGDRERAPISAIQLVANPIPEPATLGLLGLGGLALLRRRRA